MNELKESKPGEWCHQDDDKVLVDFTPLTRATNNYSWTRHHWGSSKKRTEKRNPRREMRHHYKIKHSLLSPQQSQWFMMNKCDYSNVFLLCWQMTYSDQQRPVDVRDRSESCSDVKWQRRGRWTGGQVKGKGASYAECFGDTWSSCSHPSTYTGVPPLATVAFSMVSVTHG